jgi:hypothetical protein
MPAKPTYEPYDGLTITANAAPEPDPVMWTDSEPVFKVTFRNSEEADSETIWGEGSSIRLVLKVDGDPVWDGEVEFGPLGYGEEQTVEVDTAPLTYEGHAVLAVAVGGASGLNSDRPTELRAGRGTNTNNAIYAFSVWDKSHYEATVGTPKRLQAAIIGTSVVLIIFAAVQLYVAL